MSSPIVIRKLGIRSFRGIQARLDLDFTGRLTVLLAPNGTGKTSICNAVEWLLTGGVHGFEEEDLRCLMAATEEEPSVSADIQVGSATHVIERHITQWYRRRQGRLTQANSSDVLKILASEAGSDERSAAVKANIRRSWLRGTRLLPGHDLSLLLDDDEDSVGSRRRVFADLFGVQHLDATLRQLQSYIKELGAPTRKEEQALAKMAKNIEDLEKKVAHKPPAAGFHLAQAAKLLQVSPPATDPENDLSGKLGALLAQRQDLHRSRSEGLARVQAAFPRLGEMERDKKSLERRLFAARATERWGSAWARRVTAVRDRAATDRRAAGERADEIRQRRNQLNGTWDPILAADVVRPEWSLADLHAQADGLDDRLAPKRLAAIDQLIGEVEALTHAIALRRAEEAREDFVRESLDADHLVQQEAHLESLRRNQREAAAKLQALVGPIGSLRVAGRAVLEGLGARHRDCPLCGHDWVDAAALRAAVERVMEGTDPAQQALERELETVSRLVQDQEAVVESMRLRNRSQQRWRTAVNKMDEILSRARTLGLGENPEQWIEERSLCRAWVAVTPHIKVLESMLSGPSQAPISVRVDAALTQFAAMEEGARTTESEAAKRWHRAGRLGDKLTSRVTSGKAAVAAAESALVEIEKALGDLDRDWKMVSELPLAPDGLLAAEHRLASEQKRLAEAESHLQGARASLRHADLQVDLDHTRTQFKQQQQQLDDVKKKLAMAETLEKRLTAYRDSFICQQLAALMPMVRTLFSRVHANRTFDTIVHGDDDDPLQWFAEIDGKKMPTGFFSQGQRQDLALAIFLARACSLKGTFFLDEPLVHLDDLNRVAVLDILRVIALSQPDVHLVVTTASRPLARHVKEKFGRAPADLLSVVELQGDPRSGNIAMTPMA